jgi:hypothetical protein
MNYRWVASSAAGFIQQVAVCYVRNGYWFYVPGRIPDGKDAGIIDRKLIDKYGIAQSKWSKRRANLGGQAKMQYIRYGKFFLLLATAGEHRFFEEEAEVIRDARRKPIRFAGHSVLYREPAGKIVVSIAADEYRLVKQQLEELALRRSTAEMEQEFRQLRYIPYGPVQVQLLRLLRSVNSRRKTAGLERLPTSCLRLQRKSVKPFDDSEWRTAA